MFNPASGSRLNLHIEGTQHGFKVLAFAGNETLSTPCAVLIRLAKLFALASLGLLSGCEAIVCSTMINCFDPLGRAASWPDDVAYLGLITPNYMDAHIHLVERVYGSTTARDSGSTLIETRTPGQLANGWTPPASLQKAPSFPKYIGFPEPLTKLTVEWISLPENKAYRTVNVFGFSTFRHLTREVETSCMRNEKPVSSKRNIITVALAPGGKVKAWVSGICLPAIEIAMKQGLPIARKELTENSSQTLKDYDPEPMNRYIKTHGIPYDSW